MTASPSCEIVRKTDCHSRVCAGCVRAIGYIEKVQATAQSELASGQRFAFGENWRRFLAVLDESRIRQAEISLRDMLDVQDLTGRSFLDIGSGSGLFSLAARRLGARVHSFDYDPQSVACALEIKRRYLPADTAWTIEQGSVLDSRYLSRLGKFDIVYSWGVLHHTGAMWEALSNAAALVEPEGKLFIAIYNDQGTASRRWKAVKRTYNRTPRPLRFTIEVPALVVLNWRTSVKDLLRLKPFASWRQYSGNRGMSPWRDLVDWVGGYPFEVARPEEIFDFYKARGFVLTKLKTAGGSVGCNEFVFARTLVT